MTKVLVLGGTGMLGQGVLKAFSNSKFEVVVSKRSKTGDSAYLGNPSVIFDASSSPLEELDNILSEGDFIINCIGIIKPHIKDDDKTQRRIALEINGLFPDKLADFSEKRGIKVIQIATDCVYSGIEGKYDEDSSFDALDVYGKTKSLGEVPSNSMMHLRVSIIGTEAGRSTSLWEWVRNQPRSAQINGFTDHEWNGITTYHFGRIARGIIESGLFKPGVFHVVPTGEVSKFELVSEIAKASGRSDLQIEPKPSGKHIDRTLRTVNSEFNNDLWKAAGYRIPPTVPEMIKEFPLD